MTQKCNEGVQCAGLLQSDSGEPEQKRAAISIAAGVQCCGGAGPPPPYISSGIAAGAFFLSAVGVCVCVVAMARGFRSSDDDYGMLDHLISGSGVLFLVVFLVTGV